MNTRNRDKREATTRELLDEITRKLEVIEGYMAWAIRAEQRFKKGQRVQFSRSASRKGIGPGMHGATKGTVKKIDGFIITVHLDGYKNATTFHHAFFNPVIGPKLF